MKLNNIINELADISPEQLDDKGSRRNLLKKISAKVAVAAVPLGAAMLPKTAKAQSKETLINILNYLLKLEYVNSRFYGQSLQTETLIPEKFLEQIKMVNTHVNAQIEVLKAMVFTLGGTPQVIDAGSIDLSGGRGQGNGPFLKASTDTAMFLLLMTYLSDAGVRIYKGQITEVLSDKDVVKVLSNIHSVKARHAAFARYMRSFLASESAKPWITRNDSDSANPNVQRAYAGEGAVSQAGITVVGINGFDVREDAATQAFDEPLIMLDGNDIIDRFINT